MPDDQTSARAAYQSYAEQRFDDMTGASQSLALSELLRQVADDAAGERIAVGDLLDALGDRAIGALLFVFAFPNILPMPPGMSAVLGAPLLFLAAQLTFGLRPWLPAIISKRSMPRNDFHGMVGRVIPWLQRAETLLRPRCRALALPPVEYAVGLICLLLAVVLTLPIPMGNMLPALSISLFALGLLARDGWAIVTGLATAIVAAVVVSGVIWGIVKGIIFMLSHSLL